MRLRLFARQASFLGLISIPCLGSHLSAATTDARNPLNLIEAVKEQDSKAVTALLKAHVDVNVAQPDGATALSWAVFLEDSNTVNALLKAGAKVNSADEYGETPLTLACGTGDSAMIQKLLTAGADATAARWDGETALMIAARSGSLEGVRQLLLHGAKIDAVESRRGQNALMWAASEGHADVVDLLVKSGADINATSKSGWNALVFGVQKGDPSTVSNLLSAGLSPNFALRTGQPVLLVAVAGGKMKAAQLLLEKGADPNAADHNANVPLLVACALTASSLQPVNANASTSPESPEGTLEVVKLLLAKGADANFQTAKTDPGAARNSFRAIAGQQTALLLAARNAHIEIMRALVAAGADPKLHAQDGSTLLMAAASSGHLDTVKYAFELDSDVTAVTTRKSTVMHASVTGSLQKSTQPEICKVIQFLADHGAELDAFDGRGQTPISVANVLPIDKAVDLLTQLIEAKGATPKISPKR